MPAAELPSAFPADSASVMLRGAVGAIEAIASAPDAKHARKGSAIICHPHPHPLQGGTMHNKVVTMIERSLRELGLATVIFNFRGVGASAGVFDQGNGETADADAVASWGAARWPGRYERILLDDAGVTVILDGAHNPEGALTLRDLVAAENPSGDPSHRKTPLRPL